jgi:hypothetical protein
MTSARRYYSVGEANALVPWLADSFGRILRLRSQLRGLYAELEALGHRPEDPSVADCSDEVRSSRAKFVGLMELVQEELAAIVAEGVEIKDLDSGLCDFWSLSVLPGREVYLCWRFGETRIGFYHEPSAGFAGRKPLPSPVPSS